MDTGADVTVTSHLFWPQEWSLKTPLSTLSGKKGKGYACVSTGAGPKWVPAKCVKPYQAEKQAGEDSRNQEASTQT